MVILETSYVKHAIGLSISWNTLNLQDFYYHMWYDQAKSVLSRWHSMLSFLHNLKLYTLHKLHFAENPIKIGHLVSEIWVNVGFEKQ